MVERAPAPRNLPLIEQILPIAGQPEKVPAPFPQSPFARRRQIRQEAIVVPISKPVQEESDHNVQTISGGVYKAKRSRSKNSSGVQETYTITNNDGSITIYTQDPFHDGVYEAHFSPKNRVGKRKPIGEPTRIGEIFSFTPEREPDGSIQKADSYRGTIEILSTQAFEKKKSEESLLEKEPFEQTLQRLGMRFVPFPLSPAVVMEDVRDLALLQSALTMVKSDIRQQALLGVQTFGISAASSAFLFLFPAAAVPGGAVVKSLLDVDVVMEAYQLLQSPNPKKKLQHLAWDMLKNPFVLGLSIVSQIQQAVEMRLADRAERRAFAKNHPYISNKERQRDEIAKEKFDATHKVWLDTLQALNPDAPKETIEQVAQKFIQEISTQRMQLKQDIKRVRRATRIPLVIYAGIMIPSYILAPFTGGVSLVAGGIGASLATAITRPIVNYTLLKDLKEEIQRDRPEELIPVKEILQNK